MRFSITAADIEQGEPCNGYRCPVALALNRQLPGGPWHVSSGGEIHKTNGVNPYGPVKSVLPEGARTFIELFDCERGKTLVQPSEFDIEAL